MRFTPGARSILFAGLTAVFASPSSATISQAPLKSRIENDGGSLFAKRSAESTGIQAMNPYDDPLMWSSRYREYMGGAMGSGLAAGDYDGDGNVDLFVSIKTKPGILFRNRGDWTFENVTEKAGLDEGRSLFSWFKSDDSVIWRQGATFVDVNNDGWLDLYVCRNNASNLLYINQGDGTFEEEAEKRGLAIVDGSVVGAFSDYDRDGWVDMLLLTNQVDGTEPTGRPDRLFRNLGDGRFVEVTEQAGIDAITFGHAATWFDYNGDLWPDLYLCNDFSEGDYFYRNNGDGTFTNVLNQSFHNTPYSSMGADIGDINKDGNFDLLAADMATTTRERDRRGLAASRNDMLREGTTEGIAPQYTRNALYMGTGMDFFREAACWAGLEATDWTWSVRFEDFDNDGWEDLHVTNGMIREANNSDLLARMMRGLSDMQRIGIMKRSPVLNEANLAYRNLQGEGFQNVAEEWGLDEVGVAFGAVTADFDGDGDLDIAYINLDDNLSLFENRSTDGNRVKIYLQGDPSNHFGVGAVVRIESASCGQQTRAMVVTRGYASGSELVAHFGLGDDQRIDRLTVQWPSGTLQTYEDLPVNHSFTIKEDKTTQPPPPSTEPPLFAETSESFGLKFEDASEPQVPDSEQAFIPFRTDRAGPSIAVGDVNGDEIDDIFLGATTGSPARLLVYAKGGYKEMPLPATFKTSLETGPSLLFDADGDGSPDLLVTTSSSQGSKWPDAFATKLYLNDGRGAFSKTDFPSLPLNAGAAAAGDIDGDGDLDLFLGGRSIPDRYPETPRSYLLRNDGGRFTDISDQSRGLKNVGLVKDALFRDVDRDGRIDLIVSLEWDSVRFFRNEGDGAFADQSAAAGFLDGGKGWWNGIAAADFNLDGRLDFAVGNLGLNTTYEASPEEPALLFYGDFAQNGTRMIAEAEHDAGKLYPLRSLNDLAAYLPFVKRAYPSANDYAKATLAEVFGSSALEKAQRFEADNFQSGLFLSQVGGDYRFQPFPPVAQIGPVIGLVAADFDGDNIPDLGLSQNTDTTMPRSQGGVGLYLKGLGDGTFAALEPLESGYVVTGNGRAQAIVDPNKDGKPDLFITQHAGSSLCLINQSQTDADWLTIALQDSSGNSKGVGASIELEFADGRARYYEIGLGGGWHSQSAPRLHVASQDENPLVRARVQWPDGSQSTHPAPENDKDWLLIKPNQP
ncbi:FG-GAP-like repeat-containing protein [Pelagicoccus sp. SDUM812003]|uniref:FG-GAP-like repeat-containing protein n=1 Tax=Pelagicoccus sp. SDUM812003 TaxID=3041267 RepID=UPI0028109323|nr:FG-GAP-like repeat-containing protein [Pelagicoccus sp. SDUM812003]MDQ8203510.1 FG-GAP-like repeat-containing protein [Pelagicoccus sp. SDUM812003]